MYESIKLHAKARVNKGLKKKKVYNSKLVWSSSDESLATVDQKGVVTANDNRKTGTVYITARAVNGVKKIIESGMSYIVARGRKGGSNVAAAIMNALFYMAADDDKEWRRC